MKLLFLIPCSSLHNPINLILEIHRKFPDSYIILINDNNVKQRFPHYVRLYSSKTNHSLASKLIYGYTISQRLNFDYLVRLDADQEYPISNINQGVRSLEKNEKIGIVIQGFRRTIRSNGVLDSLMNNTLGFIEGVLLTGKPFMQHSPSLQIIRSRVLLDILPDIKKTAFALKLKWGLDLVVIASISKNFQVLPLKIKNNKWCERRAIKKVFTQAFTALKILLYILTMNYINHIFFNKFMIHIKYKKHGNYNQQ